MTAIEIIALVFIAFSAIKIAVLMIKPTAWYGGPAGKLWSNPVIAYPAIIVIGAVVLWYLLAELTITQVFAAGIFGFLVFMLDLTPYTGKLFGLIQRDAQSGTNILRKSWVGNLVWIVLMILVLWEIFS